MLHMPVGFKFASWTGMTHHRQKGLNRSPCACVCMFDCKIANTKHVRVQDENAAQICVCALWLIPLCASPLLTKLFTWLWNERNVCVWANSVILPVMKACVWLRPSYTAPLPLAVNFASQTHYVAFAASSGVCVFFFFSPAVT